MRLKALTFVFLGWTVVFAGLYYWGSDVYIRLVLAAADVLTDTIIPVTLQSHPKGIVVLSPAAQQPMGMPYSMFLTCLNAIFAPALVLTTVGVAWGGIFRASLAILVMLGLHSINASTIVLFHVSHPENPLFDLNLSHQATAVFAWTYQFFDRMAYAFFPLLAWAIVCPDVISDYIRSYRQSYS